MIFNMLSSIRLICQRLVAHRRIIPPVEFVLPLYVYPVMSNAYYVVSRAYSEGI
jgi:hypothetical protein